MAHRRVGPFHALGIPAAAPPGGYHTYCVDTDGSTENLRAFQTTNKVGVDNAWTYLLWVKPESTATNRFLMEAEGNVNDFNAFQMKTVGTVSGLSMKITNSNNSANKTYDLAGGMDLGNWGLYGATWDGTNFTCYKNGSDITGSMTKTVDGSVTQTDVVYRFGVGSNQANSGRHAGRYHSLAVWDEELTAAEITAIYAGGSPFDVRNNSGDYTSSANLVRYFWIGKDGPSVGDSSTWGIDLIDGNIDLMQGAIAITSADVIEDAPS